MDPTLQNHFVGVFLPGFCKLRQHLNLIGHDLLKRSVVKITKDFESL